MQMKWRLIFIEEDLHSAEVLDSLAIKFHEIPI